MLGSPQDGPPDAGERPVHTPEDAQDGDCDAQLAKVQALADRISRMVMMRPEVLRVTAAHNVFSSCFAPLRPGKRPLLAKSQEASEIEEF